ncbi:MAG: nucleotidyltransferase domain-containing protein [Planctomycetes bacterium]|nr:nucleotidyltransferase domain-containing protein [Planctomycetota bacterium]
MTTQVIDQGQNSLLQDLQTRLGVSWKHINAATDKADETRQEIEETLREIKVPADTGLLTFGSLARKEWTSGSDVDWTLLIDGPVDPGHMSVAQQIEELLKRDGFTEPGPAGTFGGMTFSHELVHYIGGENDTNQNTTRRILLLIESASIGSSASGRPDDVRDQVLRAIIHRYMVDDMSRVTSDPDRSRVPRFLLNDIVRFWRTMAVDYASKRWERGDAKWALRNLKLRFSRKLIFVAGLLACFGAKSDRLYPRPEYDEPAGKDELEPRVGHLRSMLDPPPLFILAHAAREYCDDKTIKEMFDAYDSFLEILDSRENRDHLEHLPTTEAQTDELFIRVQEISRMFQQSLTTLFFKTNDELTKFAMEYGLF